MPRIARAATASSRVKPRLAAFDTHSARPTVEHQGPRAARAENEQRIALCDTYPAEPKRGPHGGAREPDAGAEGRRAGVQRNDRAAVFLVHPVATGLRHD